MHYSYDYVIQNPEKCSGKYDTFTGTVIRADKDKADDIFIIAKGKENTVSNEYVYVSSAAPRSTSQIQVNDKITVFGTWSGETTAEQISNMKLSGSVPSFLAMFVEINK